MRLQARRISSTSALKPPVAPGKARCSPMMNSVSVVSSGGMRFSQEPGDPRQVEPFKRRQHEVRAGEILLRGPARGGNDRGEASRLRGTQAVQRILESDTCFGRAPQAGTRQAGNVRSG